ncbi:MAG: AAA family ATPase [Oligoflexia bacterium]|nr:AAA family ATPase [Oligoflexia bacterium]
MRVTRLEVFGFKSFMERLVLPLEGGITGVVGPNGCGKSNIVDALRWVLGETKAKNLRGDVLEDVIFNGTDQFRPLGLAEVTLTLRASGESFFSDLKQAQEIESEISEILESVQTEEEAREEEIADVPLPGGRPHLTVIQGNLGAEDQPRSEQTDSTDVLETPAEKTKAEKTALPTLSTRFAWLKSVNEVQVTRRLYRSGESEFFINRVACRLKDIKELFRATGIGARSHTIIAQGEASRIVSARPEERRLIIEEAAGVLGFRDKIAAAQRKLEETRVNISRLDDILKEVSRQVSILKRQAARARNRQELKDQIVELEKRLAADRVLELRSMMDKFGAELKHHREQEEALEAALRRAQAEEHEHKNEMMTLDLQSDALRLKVDSIREELTNRARMESDSKSRVSELQALVISSEQDLKRIDEQRQVLSQRGDAIAAERHTFEAEARRLEEELARLSASGDQALADASGELETLRAELKTIQGGLAETREKLAGAKSSLSVIEQEIVANSPVQTLKDSLSKAGSGVLDGSEQFLAEGVRIAPRLAKALQAALAEKAGFVVLREPHRAAEIFSAAGSGDAAIGLVMAGNIAHGVEFAEIGFPSLLSLCEVSDDCRFAASRFLSGVHLAEDISAALAFFAKQFGNRDYENLTLVTPSGDLITAHSFYSVRHSGGLVQLMRRAEELRAEVEMFGADEQAKLSLLAAIEGKVGETEARQRAALAESQRQRETVAKISADLGNSRGKLSSQRQLLEQVSQDLEALASQERSTHTRIAQLKTEREALTAQVMQLAERDDAELKSELESINKEYQAVETKRRASRGNLSEYSTRVDEIRRELDVLRSRSSNEHLEIEKVRLEEANLRDRLTTDYGAELAQEVFAISADHARISDTERDEAKEEVQRLKARVVREGDVDPSSIERFEEENARLEELERQRHDLNQAASTLTATIEKLSETSRRRFLTVFSAVRENFTKLVPRLFGGGRGSIELLDPSHPLESGVEIMVRPPGKKLKNIDLLSGGEKALTATGMIFAMFMERPSPLCVLDEVDAPLDEANLLRFLTLIREMSARTQFLMITHNKQSMTLADHLVGVTMQEPGASKVISVSLNEAMNQVA